MPRAMTQFLPWEMTLLGLAECALSFVAIYWTIWVAGGPSAVSGNQMLPEGLGLAAILAALFGTIALLKGVDASARYFDRKRLLTIITVATGSCLGVTLLVNGGLLNHDPLNVAHIAGAWLVTISVIRGAYGLGIVRAAQARRIMVVGGSDHAAILAKRLLRRRGQAFEAIEATGSELTWSALKSQNVWGVIVSRDVDKVTLAPLLDCKMRGMRVISTAMFQETYLGRVDLDLLTPNALLVESGHVGSRFAASIKRAGDVALAIIMLLVALPLMALTAVAIKIDSTGPVFYRQKRNGQFNVPFMLFKFRSMTIHAEASGDPIWAQQQDPRVTRVGRFIRLTRIDELPQLVNVIRGDMSLVGPRPERPHFVEQLSRAIPFYSQRTYVKPGLTGWAQVNFPYGASVEDSREKLAYDLYYVKNRTLWLDVFILLSTIRVVLFQEGAR